MFSKYPCFSDNPAVTEKPKWAIKFHRHGIMRHCKITENW